MQKIVGGAFHAHEFSGARDIARKTADLGDQVIALEHFPARAVLVEPLRRASYGCPGAEWLMGNFEGSNRSSRWYWISTEKDDADQPRRLCDCQLVGVDRK